MSLSSTLLALPLLLAQFGETPNERVAKAGRIGVTVEKQGAVLVVKAVEPGTSAEKEGLRIGDQILRIDFENVESFNRSEAAAALRGIHGTRVALTILPRASMTPKRIDVVRDVRVYLPNDAEPGTPKATVVPGASAASAAKVVEARPTGATSAGAAVPVAVQSALDGSGSDVATCIGAMRDLLPEGFPSEFAADFTVKWDSIAARTEPASGDLASCLGRKAADWKLPRPGRKDPPLTFRATWSWSER